MGISLRFREDENKISVTEMLGRLRVPVILQSLRGWIWRLGFFKVQGDHDLDMLFFLDHLSHHSYPLEGGPSQDPQRGLKPSLSSLEEHPLFQASYPHPMDVFSGRSLTMPSLLGLILSKNLYHLEWILRGGSQMGPFAYNWSDLV